MHLIVTADDFGLTDGTSQAIIEAHRQGIVTATSVLALAPGAIDRLGLLDAVPELAVGVHLALVGEDPPLLSAAEIPTLVDRRGALARSWQHLVLLLASRRVDPDDVRREFDAQIDAVAAHRAVSHLDSHQHLHLWPSVAAVVADLAQSRSIDRVRVPRSTRSGIRGAVVNHLARRLERRLDDSGVAHTDHFRGVDEAGGWTFERLDDALRSLAGLSGTAEINTHPGLDKDRERSRYQWGYRWGTELEALTSNTLRNRVERSRLQLCGRFPDGST